jgi:DNA polymerase I-like protein with 3'-5' exonuclease and polymerase domains
MQNIPAKDTVVKSCFSTRFKNGILIELDYDALELKNLAHLSNDINLISVLSDPGRDIHQEAADEYKINRDEAKTFHYMLIYGASAKAIATELKIPPYLAKRLIKQFFKNYPRVPILYDNWKWEIARNENIINEESTSWYRPDETKAIYNFKSKYGSTIGLPAVKNYCNQGLGGTLIKIALSKILSDESIRPHVFRSILPIMTTHDANLFDVDLAMMNKNNVINWLRSSMTTGVEDSYESLFGIKLRVPLTVTVKCATVWSEMKEV